MFSSDNRKLESLGDRVISTGIAAVCGYLLGRMLGHFATMFFEQNFGLVWLSTIGFSVFGFVAPKRSRELWTRIWTAILGFLYKLLDTRRFYR